MFITWHHDRDYMSKNLFAMLHYFPWKEYVWDHLMTTRYLASVYPAYILCMCSRCKGTRKKKSSIADRDFFVLGTAVHIHMLYIQVMLDPATDIFFLAQSSTQARARNRDKINRPVLSLFRPPFT
ncbi:hypothetical protein I7I53_04433 [Histoplasma capsulatum var. duboisii H88]|uniref:Uncharacterized protein n=1 Tax=Ajellomyces capsulatus (strain H88) TaxID=544711 RepID=A0A8A1LSY8_AJEC8|nr:hypothetical protein I7I53_04433 [Histoplasma capsulatum var. duboisii H88]